MKAPCQASDISKEWIQYMLTEYENREHPGTTVHVDSYVIGEGGVVGRGVCGSIERLQVNATLSNQSESDTSNNKLYDLAIKFKGQNQQWAPVLKKLQVEVKEMLMYSKVLVELDNFQKTKTNNQYPINTPKFIYGKCTQDEFVLVMENIKGMGFSIHDKENNLSFEQLKMAVTQLVRLHSVSYSYNKSHSFLEKHPEFRQTEYGTLQLKAGSSALIDVQIEVIKNEKDKQELLHKIESTKNNLLKQCEEIHNQTNYKVTCLVHADAHTNNMMFKYNDCDENCDNPNDIKLFDWQLPHWNTPVLDLHFLIYTSTSREFRKEYLEGILKFYHSTFMEAISHMGVEAIDWSYEDFKKEYNNMALYGINKGILVAFFYFYQAGQPSALDKVLSKSSEGEKQQTKTQSISSDFEFQINNLVKTSILPRIKEITSRNNTNLASRVLGIIDEADENGLYG